MGTSVAQMLDEDDLGPADKALLDLLNEGRVTAPYAAEETGYSLQYVRDRLSRLVEHDNAEKVYEGLYELVSDPREESDELPPEPREPEPDPEPEKSRPVEDLGHDLEDDEGEDELPGTIEDHVVDAVDAVAASWDGDERLESRRQAALHVLQYAADTGEAVGKSHPVVDQVIAEFPVDGQNQETYWRNNIREVLKKYGTYSKGKHGYSVGELENIDGAPYDPTEEFK